MQETINEISEVGFVYSRLTWYVSAERIKWYDNFTNLLYYYGILTIGGVWGENVKLIIPNNSVRLLIGTLTASHCTPS